MTGWASCQFATVAETFVGSVNYAVSVLTFNTWAPSIKGFSQPGPARTYLILRASHMKLIRVFEISQVLEEAFSLYHEIKDCRVLSIIRKL